MHFDPLTHGDADLYPTILELAERGLLTVRQHHKFFSKHALYDDGIKRVQAVRLLGKSKGVDVGWVLRRVEKTRNEAR